jgi:transcriptional regulator with XRE-family HTH domain
MAETKKTESWRQALKRVMEEQRQLPDPDFSLPAFSDPVRLRECMNLLDINQLDLERESGVSQSFISALLRGVERFADPSRSKIWRAINRFHLDKIERDVQRKCEEDGFDPGNLPSEWWNFTGRLQTFAFFKTPLELKDEEIQLLTRERDLAREQRDTLKQLVDMNLLDRCCDLEKKLADAYTQIADFHQLFALKGSAVAGDELQERIEQRIKKPEGA